jgi:hypothetical protein
MQEEGEKQALYRKLFTVATLLLSSFGFTATLSCEINE